MGLTPIGHNDVYQGSISSSASSRPWQPPQTVASSVVALAFAIAHP